MILILLTSKINIKIYNSNIRFYKHKYNCKSGDIIQINIEDTPKKSHVLIDWKCDYCGQVMRKKRYCDYIRHKNRSKIKTDCCEKCKGLKIKQSNIKSYGKTNVMQLKKFKDRQRDTCYKNYGVYFPYQNQNILTKALRKAKKTMYKNNSAPCSRQQSYIHNIAGGELNYPIGTLNLDIAFPQDKIYIEYDGGGHDLQIKFGNLTQKQHRLKEMKREYLLASKGWKLIRIVSNKDLLPSKEKIIEIINLSKRHLKNHSWIEFNIDQSQIHNSFKNTYFDFGSLHKITKECVS